MWNIGIKKRKNDESICTFLGKAGNISIHKTVFKEIIRGLEVRTTGEVFARVPSRLSDTKIKEFIESHKDWIIQKFPRCLRKKMGDRKSGFHPGKT